MWRRPSPSLIVALIALFAALGGTAVATRYLVTSPKQLKPGVITERLLAHSVRVKLARVGNTGNTGPAGPVGPRGTKGDKGETGPIGPSVAYAGGGTAADLVQGLNMVVSVSVPAGEYVIHANVDINNAGGAAVKVPCTLEDNAGNALESVSQTVPPTNGEETFPLDGAGKLGAAGSFRVQCTEGAGQNLHLTAARLTAIKVGELNP